MEKSPRSLPKLIELHRILSGARRPVSAREICDMMEISLPTFKRLKEQLADVFNAPLVYDRLANGYHFSSDTSQTFEIPGLWLSGQEVGALLLIKELLEQISLGGLEPLLAPLQGSVRNLLSRYYGEPAAERLCQLVQFRPQFQRKLESNTFRLIVDALARDRRLIFGYQSRGRGEFTQREVSPLRILYYRDNWYLGGLCHLRSELRVFSLDRIQTLEECDVPACTVPQTEQDDFFASAYGIFTGPAMHKATLRFSAETAKWVEECSWHPDQTVRHLGDGQVEIDIPYGDDRELIMDILKYGPEVEVVAPQELREAVIGQISRTMGVYNGG